MKLVNGEWLSRSQRQMLARARDYGKIEARMVGLMAQKLEMQMDPEIPDHANCVRCQKDLHKYAGTSWAIHHSKGLHLPVCFGTCLQELGQLLAGAIGKLSSELDEPSCSEEPQSIIWSQMMRTMNGDSTS